MNTADLQFNIIFTPQTVEHLAPFVDSLLTWTDCQYCLVANGCPAADRERLQSLCAGKERLSYLVVSADAMLDHGSALDWLQERTTGEWFCFMDSDILATGSYLRELSDHLDQCDVFSAGHPLWYAPEDIVLPRGFKRWQGSYCASAEGITLGFTYFAVYRNSVLTAARARTGVGFRYCFWDDIAPAHQTTLARAGLQQIDYDTGKLLMALMHAEGARFRAAELPHLHHLGGVSARAEDTPAFHYRGRFDRLACSLAGGRLARPLLHLADTWYGLKRISPGLSAEQNAELSVAERRIMQSRIRKRVNTARYFNALLHSLMAGTDEPEPPILGYGPAEQRIRAASVHVRDLYRRLGLSGTSGS